MERTAAGGRGDIARLSGEAVPLCGSPLSHRDVLPGGTRAAICAHQLDSRKKGVSRKVF